MLVVFTHMTPIVWCMIRTSLYKEGLVVVILTLDMLVYDDIQI